MATRFERSSRLPGRLPGVDIKAVEAARRPGDPAVLVASSAKITRELGFDPKLPDAQDNRGNSLELAQEPSERILSAGSGDPRTAWGSGVGRCGDGEGNSVLTLTPIAYPLLRLIARTYMADYDISTLRHSTAHVMAHAVKKLFPEAKVAIGPAIEDGFYYDFDVARPFTPEDLENIAAEMGKIIAENKPFRAQRDQPRRSARDVQGRALQARAHPRICPRARLSRSTKRAISSTSAAARTSRTPARSRLSSWSARRGLTGAAMSATRCSSASTARRSRPRRTSRSIWKAGRGREARPPQAGQGLDLFSIQEESGPGLVFWHPKGALVRNIIEDYWRAEHYANGYEMVITPHIARRELWNTSGHLDFFSEDMFPPMEVEGQPYLIKPMNCPFHLLIYKSRVRSYRELPIRWAELGTVYRYERSGVLHGLMRVRGSPRTTPTSSARRDQLDSEIKRVLEFVLQILSRFGFTSMKSTSRPGRSIRRRQTMSGSRRPTRSGRLWRPRVSTTKSTKAGAFSTVRRST